VRTAETTSLFLKLSFLAVENGNPDIAARFLVGFDPLLERIARWALVATTVRINQGATRAVLRGNRAYGFPFDLGSRPPVVDDMRHFEFADRRGLSRKNLTRSLLTQDREPSLETTVDVLLSVAYNLKPTWFTCDRL
jgi:hypothetical protein